MLECRPPYTYFAINCLYFGQIWVFYLQCLIHMDANRIINVQFHNEIMYTDKERNLLYYYDHLALKKKQLPSKMDCKGHIALNGLAKTHLYARIDTGAITEGNTNLFYDFLNTD